MLNANIHKSCRIIPRSVELIFEQIRYLKNFGWEFNVFVSFQEVILISILDFNLKQIYNEQVRDLLTNFPENKLDISISIFTKQYNTLLKSFFSYC